MKHESFNGHQPTNHVPHMYCVTVPKLTEEPNAVNKKTISLLTYFICSHLNKYNEGKFHQCIN